MASHDKLPFSRSSGIGLMKLQSHDTMRCVGITKAFDGTRALDDFSYEFPQSGIVALIGPNGAGKTTLLNVLTGFLHPDAGRCWLGDTQLTGLSPHLICRRGIARTFQDLRLVRQETVENNVLLGRPLQRGASLLGAIAGLGVVADQRRQRRRVEELLDQVGLAGVASQAAGELSYGQQKLLTLACCLATEPRIILLDEPVAGVDPATIPRILDILRNLRDAGLLVVFVEHDMSAVRRVADLVVVMDDGHLIAQGSAYGVLERPEIIEAYVG